MGLTAWQGDAVRKGDVTVAKNYLKEQQAANNTKKQFANSPDLKSKLLNARVI